MPTNLPLFWRNKCHLNVEAVAGAKSIKYVHSYLYKGVDRASVAASDGPVDEIEEYEDCRYIGTAEALWSIYGYTLDGRYPAVADLAVHADGDQSVQFEEGREEAAHAHGPPTTTLAAYMQCCGKAKDMRVAGVRAGDAADGQPARPRAPHCITVQR